MLSGKEKAITLINILEDQSSTIMKELDPKISKYLTSVIGGDTPKLSSKDKNDLLILQFIPLGARVLLHSPLCNTYYNNYIKRNNQT